MPKGRMLNKKISHNLALNSVSIEAQLIFTWMIPHLDCKGRIFGTPEAIKGTVLPINHALSVKKIKKALFELQEVGLICIYGEANQYICFPKFLENQVINEGRETPSTLPAPELLPIDSGFTPEQVKLSKVKISKDNIPADKLYGFEEFWDLYDKKNGRTNAMLQWSKISEEDKQAIMIHVPKYKQIREKQFRKDPERYLRHKVWLDEIPVESVWESYKFNDGKNGSVDGFEDKNTGIVYYPDKKTIFYIPKEKNEKPK